MPFDEPFDESDFESLRVSKSQYKMTKLKSVVEMVLPMPFDGSDFESLSVSESQYKMIKLKSVVKDVVTKSLG